MNARAVLSAALFTILTPAFAQSGTMRLTSQDLAPGAAFDMNQVYSSCNGDNVSPELSWSGAPKNTKSYAVTLYDPDARGGWWHWLVFAIPARDHEIVEGAGDPEQTLLDEPTQQGTNDFGHVGYSGPCPPAGDPPHHYRFTVWALDVANPPFGPSVTGYTLVPWLKKHVLARGTLEGVFKR